MKRARKRSFPTHHIVSVLGVLAFIAGILLLSSGWITGFVTFQDTTQAHFTAGTFINTSNNSTGGFVSLNATFTTGNFTSRVFDAGSTVDSWDTLSWIEGVPYGENLPDGFVGNSNGQGGDPVTTLGDINMSGNALLLHLSDISTDQISDSSSFRFTGNSSKNIGSGGAGAGKIGNGFAFNGTAEYIRFNHTAAFNNIPNIIATAWVYTNQPNKSSQVIIGRWEPGQNNFTANASTSWAVMRANQTLSSDNFRGFKGGAFDGKYVYFVPNRFGGGVGDTSGYVLRYNTTKAFNTNASNQWEVNDLKTLNSDFNQFAGGTFDGRHVYIIPNNNGLLVRYDTINGNFTNNVTMANGQPSWKVIDTTTLNSIYTNFKGASFDGQHVYFPSETQGGILRYDTQGNFTANVSDSWRGIDTSVTLNAGLTGWGGGTIYDGRFVYFIADIGSRSEGAILRFDTTDPIQTPGDVLPFTQNGSGAWEIMNTTQTLKWGGITPYEALTEGYEGAAFDGRYIYFVPGAGDVVRYDTTGSFTTNATNTASGTPSWQVMRLNESLHSNFTGYTGGMFDGKYVYFLPGGTTNGNVLRYDTTGNFTNNLTNTASGHPSWQAMNMTETLNTNLSGYFGAVYDGRFMYLAPFQHSTNAHHGNIVNYDTLGGSNSTFVLYLNPETQAGGFSGGTFGPTLRTSLLTNTYFTASANFYFNNTGWHHIFGWYSGSGSLNTSIIVDGKIINTLRTAGADAPSYTTDIMIGALGSIGTNNTSSSYLNGTLDEVAYFRNRVTDGGGNFNLTDIRNMFLRGFWLNATVRTSADNSTWTAWTGVSNGTTPFTNSTLSSLSSQTATRFIQYMFTFNSLYGNHSVELYNVTLNYSGNTLPAVTINNNSNTSISSGSPTVYVTAVDPDQASLYVEVFANGTNRSYGLQQNNTATARSLGVTSDGIYSYFARAYDNNSNNVSDSNLTLIVDTAKPTVNASLTLHANQTVTNTTWVANFTIADNLFYTNYSIEVASVNYTPTGNTSNPSGLHALYITRTFTLADGNRTFAAYANDSAGNENKIVNGWVFYGSIPKINITTTNNTTTTAAQPQITVNVVDNEQASFYVDVFRNGTNISYASAVQNNTGTTMTWTNATTDDGIYSYYARAYDNNSNNVTEGNRTLIKDSTKPIVNASLQLHSNQTVTNATWVANFTMDDVLFYANYSIEVDSVNYTPTGNLSNPAGVHALYTTRTFTLAGGNHTFAAYMNDSAGNENKIVNGWVYYQDNTIPKINITTSNNTSTSSSNPTTNINVVDNEQASTYTEIISNFSTSNISYGLAQNNTATARVWNNATVTDGIYIYYGRAYDNTTNNVTEGNSTLIVDTTKPTVNASAQMHINTTVFNNSWVANFTIADNLFYTNYSIEVDSVNYTPTGNLSTLAGLHSLYITRTFTLSTGNVTAKAYANDSAGNEQFLGSSWINYQATAPTVTVNAPANNSTIVSTVPNITVTITDAEQLSFYAEIFRNGTNISYASAVQNNTQTNLTWTNASSSEGIYTYFARAYDNTSNVVSSGNRTIILDVTAPTITNVSISPLNVTVTNNSAHVFNFSITDNIYLENTIIELNNSANGSAINYSLTKDSTQFNFTINFSALANNNYTIIVYANDSGGNSARFANNWLNVNVPASGGGGETGGGEPRGEGGGGYSGASPTISVNNRSTNIPNAQKETEVFITIPITKNNVTKSETYRAVISDIVSSSANVRFGHIKGQLEPAITLNPGQEAFVDLNGDGVNDVKITLNSVAKGLADITFDVIVKQRGTGVRGPTFDELLEDEYGEEGAEGARELIITRLLAYTSVMALLAVVFVIRYIPETFGLKRRKKS